MYLITLIQELFQSFTLVFWITEAGNHICSQFDGLSDLIFHSAWYHCPLDVQRLLPLTLIAAQDPFVLTGFGNILCTRGTFVNVSSHLIRNFNISWVYKMWLFRLSTVDIRTSRYCTISDGEIFSFLIFNELFCNRMYTLMVRLKLKVMYS